MRAVIVGAGIFGCAAALELSKRGHGVTLIDPGPLPNPDASSTDISKMVRLDYGADVFYTELMEEALRRWRALNAQLSRPLFHETGFLVLERQPLEAGSFGGESLRVLAERGHVVERLDAGALEARFEAWDASDYPDGYFNPQGGWAESGAVTSWFAEAARAEGAELRLGHAVASLVGSDRRVTGVTLSDGAVVTADAVVVAAGAYTPWLLPELAGVMRVVAQPVLHFTPPDVASFLPPRFVPWAADIATTGYYGFSANADGIVKVANHGPGVPVEPGSEPRVAADAEETFRRFLARAIPGLADAPLSGSRLCRYCDSVDGDFWICRHPEREGLVVAAGGSGHGFKFAPVLGEIIADAVDGRAPHARFGWRDVSERRFEEARHSGARR